MRLYITECGAVPDGATLCTESINKAIDTVAEAGGGYVVVPPGKFLSGTIVLKSNVYLELEPGSTILSSLDKNDFISAWKRMYGHTQVLMSDVENSGVVGYGTIDLRRNNITDMRECGRPYGIFIIDSKNVSVRDVSILNSAYFTIYSITNENVTFDNVFIRTRGGMNGDGIDFSGSKNVTISNCNISAGDDAIGLKTHFSAEPCENFTITNCVLSSTWAGIRIGPETCGDMLNITVSNCVFNDCSDGIKIQLCEDYRMEDLIFSNLNMNNVLRPIFMTSNSYPMGRDTKSVRPNTGIFKRILIDNVIAHMNTREEPGWFENQILINGLPEAPIEDLMISNMHVIAPGGGHADTGAGVEVPELISTRKYPDLLFEFPEYPSSCMYIKNAARVKLNNCVFETKEPDERPAIVAESIDGMTVAQAEVHNCSGLIRHYKVENLKLINCDGEVTTLSPEFAARWDAFRNGSLAQEKRIIENAGYVDTVIHEMKATFKCPAESCDSNVHEFVYDYAGGINYLYMDMIVGSPKVWINGEEVYSWVRGTPHKSYMFGIRIAFDVTDLLKVGENTIKIVLEDGHFERCGVSICTPKDPQETNK